jgi:hypothetical protein
MYSVSEKRGSIMMFKEQAESCRRQACDYAGRPEAPFLLSVARAFDELAVKVETPNAALEPRAMRAKLHS